METITINITRDDYRDSSDYGSNYNCPLAHATKRQLETQNVCAGGVEIDINDEVWRIQDEFDHEVAYAGKRAAFGMETNNIITSVILTKI